MKFLGLPYNDFEWARLQKVPLIIRYPGLRNGERVSTTGGQIDILPTIANLLGIKAPYTIGKDLLNTKKGYAILRNGSVVTDRYIYLNSRGEIYDIVTGKRLSKKDYEKELNIFLILQII